MEIIRIELHRRNSSLPWERFWDAYFASDIGKIEDCVSNVAHPNTCTMQHRVYPAAVELTFDSHNNAVEFTLQWK